MIINIKRRGAIHENVLLCMMFGMFALSATVLANGFGDNLAEPMARASAQPDEAAGSFGYLSIAGAAFHPLDSSTTYSYEGGGCISKLAGDDPRFAHRVVLPNGVVVSYLRLYYYDDSTSAVIAFFTTYDGVGNYVEQTSVGSTNAVGGYSTELSPLFSYGVDRYVSAINVVANLGTENSSTLRFCGVRIAYGPPITDRIFANGFELIPL